MWLLRITLCLLIGCSEQVVAGRIWDGGATGETIRVEAESGVLVAPFELRSDPSASGGQYVFDFDALQGMPTGGSATYTVTTTAPGTFTLWCRILAPTTATDSFFVEIDGASAGGDVTGRGMVGTEWFWVQGGNAGVTYEYPLSPGDHQVVFRSRESQSQLDAFVLTSDSAFVP